MRLHRPIRFEMLLRGSSLPLIPWLTGLLVSGVSFPLLLQSSKFNTRRHVAMIHTYVFNSIILFFKLIEEEHNSFCFELNPIAWAIRDLIFFGSFHPMLFYLIDNEIPYLFLSFFGQYISVSFVLSLNKLGPWFYSSLF